ncbi:MAG TPA: carboxymuconolactone decarboxylase family protein [Tepidisphaeraceae bacterium]|nr:carboxymuconolactone decarboxylase family protein [Tepidisphaeraceae bacterium]
MPTNAEQYYEHNALAMKEVRASMPDLTKGFAVLHQASMNDGALTKREKELIAIGIALASQCENCIYAHVSSALKAGATREQILEAAGVGVLMHGGPAYTYLPRILEAVAAAG